MASKNKTTQPPLMVGKKTFGQHLARIRKEKGLTQVELAEKMGVIQVIISDYELDKLRPYHEMIVKFAKALGVSADRLLGLKGSNGGGYTPSLKLIKRMKKIEALPITQQKFILKTIDSLVKAALK